MNLKISSILIVFTILPLIYCQTFSPKEIKNTNNSITFEWDIKDSYYYTKWEITKADGNKTEMDFICTSNTTIRSCTYTNTGTLPMNQLYGISAMPCFMNGSSENCQGTLQPSHYPTPIIDSTISPIPVDGETITLVGSFIIFIVGNDSNYFQLSSGGIANFNTPLTLDPTHMSVHVPAGCGGDSFKWPSGSRLSFSYSTPTVSKTSISSDGNYIIVDGSNFCNKTNNVLSVHLGGVLQDKVKIQSTLVQIDVSEILYTEKLNFYMMFGTTIYSNQTIVFSPILNSVNSVPHLNGGNIIITGKRLTTPPTIKSNITLGFESTCRINIIDPSYITCSLQPGYANRPTDLFVEVGNIMSSNNLTFIYDVPKIRSSSQNANIITLFGDCFGYTVETQKIPPTNITIEGTYKIKNLNISEDQTFVSFALIGNYSGNTLIELEAYSISGVAYNITLKLYVIPSDPILTSGGPTHFKYYFLSPDGMKPTITVNNVMVLGDDSSKELKDDGSYAYSFNNFPPICGTESLQYIIGNQGYNGSITSQPPIFGNCTLSSTTNITTCSGINFGGTFSNQVLIQLSNNTITPLTLTDEEFSFYTDDSFVSNHLTINSCGAATDLYYNIDPVYFSNMAVGFHNYSSNDAVIIYGKYFSSGSIASINCNGTLYPTCSLTDYKTLSCGVQLIGPYDQTCQLTFLNRSNIPVFVSFQQPLPLSSNSLNLNGGQLVIFGDCFYPQIQDIQIGPTQCTNYIFISSSAISCDLPSTTNQDLLNQVMFINITIAGKSGGGYAFTYSPLWVIEVVSNSVDSMIIITTIIIAFAIGSVYIQFAFLFYKNKNNRREPIHSYTPKPINQRKQLTRQLTQPLFIIPQQTSSSRSNSISRY
ncbi:hypothetical protein ACTA71_004536 [Dictyostelium dimigraforme]